MSPLIGRKLPVPDGRDGHSPQFYLPARPVGRSGSPLPLMEDQGPAAEALEAAGVSTRQARHVVGLGEARPVQGGATWPPAPNPRAFSWPDGQRRPLPQPEPPSPNTTPRAVSFGTNPGGHELELTAERNGPIKLRAQDYEVTIEFDAHTAEILARHLQDFHEQLEIDVETDPRCRGPRPSEHAQDHRRSIELRSGPPGDRGCRGGLGPRR
jgi:hypothetical protein